jgi:hypothetical protein
MKPRIITSDDIDEHWAELVPEFKRSIARNVDGYTLDDMLAEIKADRSFVITIHEGGKLLMASTVDIQPKALHVHLFSGYQMSRWIKLFMDCLIEVGRGMGKKHYTSMSRRGMVKALKPWAKPHSVYMAGEIK